MPSLPESSLESQAIDTLKKEHSCDSHINSVKFTVHDYP